MNTSPTRILFVDDNQDSRELLSTILFYADSDYVVTCVEKADKALALIETEAFDLYIFDNGLPEMSGVELCQYLRQYDKETPILFFSGMARSVDQAQALAAGANDYLIKPIDVENLTETVKKLLNLNKSVSNEIFSH